MAKNATPEVEGASTPEMDTTAELSYELEPYESELVTPEPPADEQPVAEPSAAGENDSTSRRSRRQRAADRGERQAKPAKNLDEDADFRAYKAKAQAELAAERRQRTALEQQWADQQRQQQQQQYGELNRRLGETADDNERAGLIGQMSYIQAQEWLRWEEYKRQRIQEEGLELTDSRFQKQYQGQEGAVQFDRDVLAAAKEKLAQENAELKKATNPQTIAEIVKKQVALALHGQGLDNSDPGVGEMPDDNDALERDIAALNAGQMRAAKFAQKWGR